MSVSLKENYTRGKINHDVWMGLSNSESWTRHGLCENCGDSSDSTKRNILIWNTVVSELGIAHTYCSTRTLYTTKRLLRNWSHHVRQRQSVKFWCDVCPVYFRLSSTWLPATSLISLTFQPFLGLGTIYLNTPPPLQKLMCIQQDEISDFKQACRLYFVCLIIM